MCSLTSSFVQISSNSILAFLQLSQLGLLPFFSASIVLTLHLLQCKVSMSFIELEHVCNTQTLKLNCLCQCFTSLSLCLSLFLSLCFSNNNNNCKSSSSPHPPQGKEKKKKPTLCPRAEDRLVNAVAWGKWSILYKGFEVLITQNEKTGEIYCTVWLLQLIMWYYF